MPRDYHADIVDYCRAYYDCHRYLPTALEVAIELDISHMTAWRHMRAAQAIGALPSDALTQRQAEVLDYYRAYIIEHGQGPTLIEAARALHGDRSYVHECLQVLVARGLLAYNPHRRERAIVLPDSDERSAA